ncbi:filamin-B isoform X1 [Lates japonicus]|uniref:Filamin-B isoform X1 n=1 Tax=Lates japonicus TaxID=270547 RepID=A0AAD3NFX3_LATJO|nr:filamin-B isoform X1 [Lates japonicus]
MPATEKDLAEDAPWKKIQQNTFTRWINEHLKCVNKRIGDLQLDLGDGLRLIALLEVLSHKKMYRKYHPRPNFRQMKLENVSVALEFLDKENIKLVSIDLTKSSYPGTTSVTLSFRDELKPQKEQSSAALLLRQLLRQQADGAVHT